MSPREAKAWEARDRAWAKYDRAVARKDWAAAEKAQAGIARTAKVCEILTRGRS